MRKIPQYWFVMPNNQYKIKKKNADKILLTHRPFIYYYEHIFILILFSQRITAIAIKRARPTIYTMCQWSNK